MKNLIPSIIVCLVFLIVVPLSAQAFESRVADRGMTSVTIEWDAAPSGFQGYYKVWRDEIGAVGTSSNHVVAYTSSDLSKVTFTDLDLQSGGHYKYTVQLYDATDHLVFSANPIEVCTQRSVPAIQWTYVAIGVLVIVLLIAALFYGAGGIIEHPVGMLAIASALVLGFGLIGFGVTATSFVAAC